MKTTLTQILEDIDEYLIPGPWWAQGPDVWGPDGDRVVSCDENLALAPHIEAHDAARNLAALRNALPSWRALVAELEIVLARPAGVAPDKKDLDILREALTHFRLALLPDSQESDEPSQSPL